MRISDWSSDVCSSDLFGKGEAVGINLRQGELVGPHFRRDADAAKPLFAPCGDVEADRVVQLPFTLHIMPARGCGDAAQDVVKARENADVAQFGFSSSPHASAPANKLTAFADPDVGLDAAISRDRAIVNILPRAERRVGPSDNRSEEHTAELQSPMRISYAVFC